MYLIDNVSCDIFMFVNWNIIHDDVENFKLSMLIQNIKRTCDEIKIIAGDSICSFDCFRSRRFGYA